MRIGYKVRDTINFSDLKLMHAMQCAEDLMFDRAPGGILHLILKDITLPQVCYADWRSHQSLCQLNMSKHAVTRLIPGQCEHSNDSSISPASTLEVSFGRNLRMYAPCMKHSNLPNHQPVSLRTFGSHHATMFCFM